MYTWTQYNRRLHRITQSHKLYVGFVKKKTTADYLLNKSQRKLLMTECDFFINNAELSLKPTY